MAAMRLPASRGPLTELLINELSRPPHDLSATSLPSSAGHDVLDDEDLQLALFICYELHYIGFQGVDDGWEWDPSLLRMRQELERRFEQRLAELIPSPTTGTGDAVAEELSLLTGAEEGPSLSRFLQRQATLEQFREFVVHRSIYHLKEADPHSWAIPRTKGRCKAALVEIQMGEYGDGRVELMHSELYRTTMRGLDLDDTYGAYINVVPAITLALNNLMSFFGLHRRRLGALLGHLAALEMTSSAPNRRYSSGLARIGADRRTRRFFDEHVQADAVHEQVAANDLCGSFVAHRPDLRDDVLFGAASCVLLDRLFAEHVLERWQEPGTSLRHDEESL